VDFRRYRGSGRKAMPDVNFSVAGMYSNFLVAFSNRPTIINHATNLLLKGAMP
jgi:hypothetical protein